MAKKKSNDKKISLSDAKKLIPINLSDLKLNNKQFKFVAVYCTNNFNKGAAYEAAGFKSKNKNIRDSNANHLLNQDKIQEAIKRFAEMLIRPYRERFEVMLLDTYYRRAFYNIKNFYNDDGSIKELDEIDEEWSIVIDGVERKYFGKDADTEVIIYKLADRSNSLKVLWDYVYNVFKKDNEGDSLPEESRKKIQDIFERKFPAQLKKGKKITTFRKISEKKG